MIEHLEIDIISKNNGDIATIYGTDPLISDVNTAIDFLLDVRCSTGCYRFVIYRDIFCDEFYNPMKDITSDILKKFTDYSIKIAIVGQWEDVELNFLRSTIKNDKREKSIFIADTKKRALKMLSKKNK